MAKKVAKATQLRDEIKAKRLPLVLPAKERIGVSLKTKKPKK